MPCIPVKLVGGGTAIVCTGRRAAKKCKCGKPATLLCDWKVPTRKSGTCDAPICAKCSTNPVMHGRVDFDKDLCPTHAAEFEKWKADRS